MLVWLDMYIRLIGSEETTIPRFMSNDERAFGQKKTNLIQSSTYGISDSTCTLQCTVVIFNE